MSQPAEPVIGDEYWAWQVQEADGRWSLVGAMLEDAGGLVHTPLMLRHRDLAENARGLAEAHAAGTGQPLRLAHFTLNEVVE